MTTKQFQLKEQIIEPVCFNNKQKHFRGCGAFSTELLSYLLEKMGAGSYLFAAPQRSQRHQARWESKMRHDRDAMLRKIKRDLEEIKLDQFLKDIQMERCANCAEQIGDKWYAHVIYYGDEHDGEAETVANYCPRCISVDTSRTRP